MSIKSLIKTIFFGTLFKYACTIIRLQMHVRQRLCTSDICQPWNFGSECVSDNRSRHILIFSYYSSSKLMQPQKKKSRIAKSGDLQGQGKSPRRLINLPGKRPRNRTIICWCSIMLPPHYISINVMGDEIPLDNIVSDDTQVFSCILIWSQKMWPENVSISSDSNPYHHLIHVLICTLLMTHTMIGWMALILVNCLKFVYNNSKFGLGFEKTLFYENAIAYIV